MDTNLQTLNIKKDKKVILYENFDLDIIKADKNEKSIDYILNYVGKQIDEYLNSTEAHERKSKGQFFTQKEVALFMVNEFDINKQTIKLLDPGAGIGMLSAAFCCRILESQKPVSISIDAYENDIKIIPYLKKVFVRCKVILKEHGHKFNYNIIEKNFILNNPNYLNKETLFPLNEPLTFYDYIISNPPYYKLNIDSPQSILMKEYVSGQPNIYTFFMALSLEMLLPKGEMVFIIPRCFCSGLYFKKFREWLLNNGIIKSIHMFESRSDVFSKNEVLQENVIIKIIPENNGSKRDYVIISTSNDKQFHDLKKMNVSYKDILHRTHSDIFIKVPTNKTDIMVQHIINSWTHSLKDFNMKVSTGPIVSFRAVSHLSQEFIEEKTTAPLLWMHNIQDMDVIWPLKRKNKEGAIKINEMTIPILVPVKNYVLIKRFTSKEQKRRLYAGVFLKSNFNFERIGIENHLNYIRKAKGILSDEETYGLAGIFNTSLIDRFFRMMNGNTQVNATDIMNLPLPSLDKIEEIGGLIKKSKPSIGLELDKIVLKVLEIDNKFIGLLKGGCKNNEEN